MSCCFFSYFILLGWSQSPRLLFLLSWVSSSALIIFLFAADIAEYGTFSLQGPTGSGKSDFCYKGRTYFKIDIIMLLIEVAVVF